MSIGQRVCPRNPAAAASTGGPCAVLAGLCCTALLAAGCSASGEPRSAITSDPWLWDRDSLAAPTSQPPVSLPGDPPGSAPVTPPSAPPAPLPGALVDSFKALRATIPGDIGVAVTSAEGTVSFGPRQSGPAWSTIKVPIAVAALRAHAGRSAPLVERAITSSSNVAAEQLWLSLGSAAQAGEAVEGILRESGDTETAVQTRKVRPEFSVFGQTQWTLERQAQFAAQLPCLAGAEQVLADMRQLIPAQQWGLSEGNTNAAKAGWGPDPQGNYLVRQFAVMSHLSGHIGVAIAVTPTDGAFDSGVKAANRIAQWVGDNLGEFAGSTC